jgi:hypothetical protein
MNNKETKGISAKGAVRGLMESAGRIERNREREEHHRSHNSIFLSHCNSGLSIE